MQRFLNRTTAPSTVTLMLMASTGALAMNVFLPSLPGMARYFDADYRVVQLAVPVFLTSMALLQLILGPLSDRFGRRPVTLVSFAIFIAATIAAVYAPTIEFLLVCRVFQAFAAAGMVLARAIVRDTVERIEDAASRIGYVTMGMAMVPMVGPLIGGLLDELYGWKSTFLLTLAFGVAAFLIVWFDLGETNRHKSHNILAQMRNYPELLRSRRFWGYTLTAGFSSGAFFAFLGGGPYVATEMLGMSPSAYGLYFALLSGGYMTGSYITGRYSRRFGINSMMIAGNLLSSVTILISLALFWSGFHHPAALFVPIMFTGMGNGLSLPNANAGLVSIRQHLAGSASGLGATIQLGTGALLAIASGAMLTPDSGPDPMLWTMFFSTCAAIACTLYVMRVSRQAEEGG